MFQRLRRIKQLGTTHLVFHGAEHSRFQHSLGTLHMTEVMIDNVRSNKFSQYKKFGTNLQDNAFVLITRLGALMHDLYEYPFSHTLEKEGGMFKKQWKESLIIKKLMGEKSEIYSKTCNYIMNLLTYIEELEEDDDGKDVSFQKFKDYLQGLSQDKKEYWSRLIGTSILAISYQIITITEEKQAMKILKELFPSVDISAIKDELLDNRFLMAGNQIILNTICADLLDYLLRDFYFVG